MAYTGQKTKLEFRLETTATSREIVIDIRPVLSKQAGKKACFRLSQGSEADVPGAVNRKVVLLEKTFTVRHALHTFRFKCPAGFYTFAGRTIRTYLSGHLYVNDAWIGDTSIRMNVEVPFARGTSHLEDDPGAVLSPADKWSYSAQWAGLTGQQKRKIYLHWATLPFTVGLMIYLAAPPHKSTVFGWFEFSGLLLFIAGIFWFLYASIGVVNRSFRDWMVAGKIRRMGSRNFLVEPGTRSRTADWLKGKILIDTSNLRLRVVVANMGYYQQKIRRRIGEGKYETVTVTRSEPCRAVVLYDREFDGIPAGTRFENVFTDQLDFSPVFTDLYPPQLIGSARGGRRRRRKPTHGVGLRLEFQLLHPGRVDKVLVWDHLSIFAAAPFLQPPGNPNGLPAGEDAEGEVAPPLPPADWV